LNDILEIVWRLDVAIAYGVVFGENVIHNFQVFFRVAHNTNAFLHKFVRRNDSLGRRENVSHFVKYNEGVLYIVVVEKQ